MGYMSSAQNLTGQIVDLYTMDFSTAPYCSNQTRIVYTTTAAVNCIYSGITYTPGNLGISGISMDSGGTMPSPTLQIDHSITGKTFPLVINSDVRGVKVTRIRVPAINLDTGSSPNTSIGDLATSVYFIDGIQSRDGTLTTYKLSPALGLDNLNATGNRTLSSSQCNLKYRKWNPSTGQFVYTLTVDGGCPWGQASSQSTFPNCGSNWGTPYFDSNDAQTSDPSQDHCSLTISGCLKRFPVNPANTNPPDPFPISINLKASSTGSGPTTAS